MYYLQTRYYNAEWGRFINADSYIGTPGELLSCNMFAYCGNNPVNRDDPNGEFWGLLAAAFVISPLAAVAVTVILAVAVALIVIAVVTVAVATYRNSHISYSDSSSSSGPSSSKSSGSSSGKSSSSTKSNNINSGPYSNLTNHKSVAPGKRFTQTQKKKIIEENKSRNAGQVKSDDPTDMHPNLVEPQKSVSGVKPPANEWQIDHIVPRSKGGTNGYDNARVISRQLNRLKWDK